jgi:hypothetical protein
MLDSTFERDGIRGHPRLLSAEDSVVNELPKSRVVVGPEFRADGPVCPALDGFDLPTLAASATWRMLPASAKGR